MLYLTYFLKTEHQQSITSPDALVIQMSCGRRRGFRMELRGTRPAWPSLGYRRRPLPQGGKNAPPHWRVREATLAVNGSTVTHAGLPACAEVTCISIFPSRQSRR